jgi:DNA polymerase I
MTDTIALIDGNALIHRAFHALPDNMNTPTGEPSYATYGFTTMLLRALADLHPTHLAAAFDTPKPTFRHLKSEAYKATRPPTPDALGVQFRQVEQVLEALSIPIFRIDGLEADDLLGTLGDRSSELGLDVIIITGDTDALQLVGPRVKVLVPKRGLTDTVLYDEAAVRERYGLDPRQLVDLRALRGDSSDNIPGIPGIGDKTAAKLLQAYGDVDNLIEHIDQLPPRQAEQIRPYVEQMKLSQHLAQIVRDADVDFDVELCRLRAPERERVLTVFHGLGFRSLIPRVMALVGEPVAAGVTAGASRQAGLFDDAPAPSVATMTEGRVVTSLEELQTFAQSIASTTETLAVVALLDRADAMRAQFLGIALGTASSGAAYVPFAGAAENGTEPLPISDALEILRPVLEDPRVAKASQNAKQAMVVLGRSRIDVQGATFDSGLAAYLLEPSQRTLGLADLSWSRLNRELPGIKTLTGEGRAAKQLDAIPIPQMATHLIREVETLLELTPILEQELIDNGLDDLYRQVELPLVAVLAAMERAGLAVDVPYLQEFSKELYERLTAVERGIYDSVGHEFNINSPTQLAAILFDELKLPGAKRTATGKASTAADVLNGLRGAHPCIELILEHRELSKLKSTYVDALPLLVNAETGRIHTTLNQTVAATGRLSSENPNLQNLPVRTELGRRVRRAFVAPEPGWKILSADYSQIELRIQAHMTQDPTLVEAFREGLDVHAATAAEMNNIEISDVTSDQRRLAKTANFAIMYGISPFGFSEQTGLSNQQASDFIRRYFERFKGVEQFQKRLLKESRETGMTMTLLGRKRIIPELKSAVHGVRAAGERMAINAPVQGTASDIIKIAMIRLYDFMTDHSMRARLLLQVHDELLFEVPEEELDDLKATAKEIMEGAMVLSVPLVVEMRAAENWGAMY